MDFPCAVSRIFGGSPLTSLLNPYSPGTNRRYFSTVDIAIRRPFGGAVFHFHSWAGATLKISLLVDPGADRTNIAPLDALKLDMESGIRLDNLPQGEPSIGVGGKASTRLIDADLTSGDGKTIDHWQKLTIIEPPETGPLPTYPSLLAAILQMPTPAKSVLPL